MEETKKTRGPAKGTGGRPTASAELLGKAHVLREYLERPADPTRPHLGSVYELVRKRLADQLPDARRLGAWWRKEKCHLTDEEIEICWRWLLPL